MFLWNKSVGEEPKGNFFMQTILNLFVSGNSSSFISLFFKVFALLFATMYFIYTIVISRQTNNMNQTFKTNSASILQIISNIQIAFALILLFISFVLI